jgi:hypothetical protein
VFLIPAKIQAGYSWLAAKSGVGDPVIAKQASVENNKIPLAFCLYRTNGAHCLEDGKKRRTFFMGRIKLFFAT